MKSRFFLNTALIIALTGTSSCIREKSSTLLRELEHAEKIIYEYPDSALIILQQMQIPSSDYLPHATWCLLITQAEYKNYIKPTSDSILNIAYKYFMQQENPQRKAMVLYYKGEYNSEKEETQKAIEYYLKATKEVIRTKDYQLSFLIYSALGVVYAYNSLYDYAKDAFLESNYYAKLSGNDTYISTSLSLIARMYAVQSDWDQAIKYYKEAIETGKNVKDPRAVTMALSEISGIYRRMGNYELALKHAKEALNIKSKEDVEEQQTFLSIGDIYRRTGEKDSAYFYLQKAACTDNIYTKRSAYQAMYYLSKHEKDYKKAIEYGDVYQSLSDSIHEARKNSTLIEMQEKYNQEKILNEKNKLEIEKGYTIKGALSILVILLSIIAILIYIYQRKLIGKERMIQRKEEEIRVYNLKIQENENLINRNKNRVKELVKLINQQQEIQELLDEQKGAIEEIQKQNELLKEENEQLQDKINLHSYSLQEKSKELHTLKQLSHENMRLQDREKFLCNQLIKGTSILNNLKRTPKYLDPVGWKEVFEAIDWLYENYTHRLTRQLSSLTESDLQICCLIKLHIAIPETAIILGISSTSVSKRKLRLKERIIQELGQPFDENQTLDLWLWEY